VTLTRGEASPVPGYRPHLLHVASSAPQDAM